MEFVLIIAFVVCAWILATWYPKWYDALVFFVIAPFLGFTAGGFFWSITAILSDTFNTLSWFFSFIAIGVFAAIVIAVCVRGSK